MKTILSSKRHHYLARASMSLIVVSLIVGMVGCDGCGDTVPTKYNLTMAVDPAPGGTATDETNASPYAEGAIVSIKAEANTGYEFAGWTAPAGTLADANAEETTFTMPAQDVTLTANFFQGQLIHTWYDLDNIRDNLGGDYLLMNDLDSATAGYQELASPTANEGVGWQPIGSWHEPDEAFTGTFDGQGYEIRDLFINRPSESYVGLFCLTYSEAVIENVGVVSADVTGHDAVGALVGANGVSVSDSYSTGSVSGDRCVGGLVGGNMGNVTDCYSTGSVCAGDTAGGLVGWNRYGTVSNSYSTGSVSGNYSLGGLVGWNDLGAVSNSYSTGSVSGNYTLGGLVGLDEFDGTVTNSFWDTQTSGQATSDGGTGRTTAEMQDITTFSSANWDIAAVANPSTRNPSYIWNIVDDETYPFLSWEPVS